MPFDSAASSGDCSVTSAGQPLTTFSNCDSNNICITNQRDTASNTAVNKLPAVELAGSTEKLVKLGPISYSDSAPGQQVLPIFRDFPAPIPVSPPRPGSFPPGGQQVRAESNPFPPRADALKPGDQPLPPGPIQPAPMVGSFTADQVRQVLADRDRAVALNRGQKPNELPRPGVGPFAPSPDGRIPNFPRPDAPPAPSDVKPRPNKIEFHEDLQAARQAAIDSGRPLIISFESPNCGACTQMNRDAWPNQTGLVNDNAIRVKLNGSRNREAAQRYGVTGYPTTVVVNPNDMSQIDKARGAVSSQELSNMLQNVFRKHRGGG